MAQGWEKPTRTSRSFSVELLSSWAVPSTYQCRGLFLLRYRMLHIPLLLSPHEIPVSPFLQLAENPLDGSTAFWCVGHSSQSGVISRLAEGTRYPIIQKILNRNGPSIDPPGIPLVTVIQLGFVSLITTLCVQLFSQFSIHFIVCWSSMEFISFSWDHRDHHEDLYGRQRAKLYWTWGRKYVLFFPHPVT